MKSQLLSSQQTRKVERLVIRAAAERFGRGRATPIYEHGQWWVSVQNRSEDDYGTDLYSVVDASPSVAGTGLDFEAL